MSRYQTIQRPTGPLDAEALVRLLKELGERPPRRIPRPHTRRRQEGLS
jgi:hypothetical protein